MSLVRVHRQFMLKAMLEYSLMILEVDCKLVVIQVMEDGVGFNSTGGVVASGVITATTFSGNVLEM